MQTEVNFIITGNNVVVNYDGQTHIISRRETLASELIDVLKSRDYEKVEGLLSRAKRLEADSKGVFTVQEGKAMVNGIEAHPVVAQKIADFMNEGLPYEPLMRFTEKLGNNPSERAKQELYAFLDKNNHPITKSGNFIGYKKVRDDFKDVHTGTFDNSPGLIVEMPREAVDDNPNQTCSRGLHLANWEYASNFYVGGKMLECEVDPADVVAVPVDYNQAKMRVCKYKVIGIVDQERSEPLYSMPEEESISEECDMTTCQECGIEIDEGGDMCEDCNDYNISAHCGECGEELVEGEDEFCSNCEPEFNLEEESPNVSEAEITTQDEEIDGQ
jgi:hypothetical protein